jgi:hypothetical protein
MFTSVFICNGWFQYIRRAISMAAIAASSAHMQRAIGAHGRSCPRITLAVERMCDGAMLGSKLVVVNV